MNATTAWLVANLPAHAAASDADTTVTQSVSYAVDGCRMRVDDTTYVTDDSRDAGPSLDRYVVRLRSTTGGIAATSADIARADLPRGVDFGTKTHVTLSLGSLDASHVSVEHLHSIDSADGTVHEGIDNAWIAFPFAATDSTLANRVAQAFRDAIGACAT